MYTEDAIHLLFFNFWLDVEYLETRFVLWCKCRAVLHSVHVSDDDFCCRISIVASYWFFTCSTLLCLSLQYTQSFSHVDLDGSRRHSFLIWNDILQFCPRRFNCRWKQLRQERWCGFTHMQSGSDVQSMVICLDASLQTFCLFQCLILFPYLFQVPWDCCD